MPRCLDLYAGALAVLFAPVQEDFGLVALEAMSAGKAVVTTLTPAGPASWSKHGRTGFVCAPDPAAIGERAAQLVKTAGSRGRWGGAAGPARRGQLGGRGHRVVGRARRVTGWHDEAIAC